MKVEWYYIYTSDTFGNNGEFVTTFDEFKEMVHECFPEFEGELTFDSDSISSEVDGDCDQVAERVTPEMLAERWENGDDWDGIAAFESIPKTVVEKAKALIEIQETED